MMQGYNFTQGGGAQYQAPLPTVAPTTTYPILATTNAATATTAQPIASYTTTAQPYTSAIAPTVQNTNTGRCAPGVALGPGPGQSAFNPAPVNTLSASSNYNTGVKLFVGQVPAVCTEDQLLPVFAEFGPLLEVKIMRERNGHSKGSAWVRYENEESARNAIAALNEKYVVPPQTNPLRVQFAAPSNPKRLRTQFSVQAGGGNYVGPSATVATAPMYTVSGARGYGGFFNGGGYNDLGMQYTSSVNRVGPAAQSGEPSSVSTGDASSLAMSQKVAYVHGGMPVGTSQPQQQQQQQQQTTPQQGGTPSTTPMMSNVVYAATTATTTTAPVTSSTTSGAQASGANVSGAYATPGAGDNVTLNTFLPNTSGAQWRRPNVV